MRTYLSFSAILFVALLILGMQAPPARAVVPPGYTPVGPGDVYLALGDSVATGTEAAANQDGLPGYPAFLFATVDNLNPALDYVLLARDGETSTSMLAPGGQLDAAVAEIASRRASGQRVGLVTLTIGGNDFVNAARSFSDPASALVTFRTNYAQILDQLQAALQDTNGARQGDLLVMDYYNPYPEFNFFGFGNLADEWVPRFNAALKEAATARGIPVAEVAEAFRGSEQTLLYVQRPYPQSLFDPNLEQRLDYHPRPAGQRVIADQFFAVSGYQVQFEVYLPALQR